MRKAIGATMLGLAVLMFMVGMIVAACEAPTLTGQMRNAVIGFGTMIFGFLIGWAGDKIGRSVKRV